MATTTFAAPTAAELLAFVQGEPEGLVMRRLEALSMAQDLSEPDSRRTPIATGGFADSALPTRLAAEPAGPGALVVQDGTRVAGGAGLPEGVILTDFASAVRAHPELVLEALFSGFDPAANRFTALHAALMHGGVFLHVARGVELQEPLSATLRFTDDGYHAPHVLIVAEPRARLQFILELSGDGAPRINGAVEVVARDGASVQYCELQRLSSRAKSHWPRRAVVGRDAHVDWITSDIGSRLLVSETRTRLVGQGGECNLFATFFGGKRQHFDLHQVMQHEGTHTKSDMNTRGVLQGHARTVYNANTVIAAGASGTSGWQHEHTLMLSDDSRADLIPELEIDDADVAAGHAASAGPVDPMQIYYLAARGIPEVEARRLIVAGFLSALLEKIPIAEVRDRIGEIFAEKVEV